MRAVMSEFESGETVTIDNQFTEECSRVVSEIEARLQERRVRELSREEAIRTINQNLMDARSDLARMEREHAAKIKEIAALRERRVKPVASNLSKLKEELNRIVRMRAGFLRGISKKAKAEKQAAATRKLESTEREMEEVERSFAVEQQRFQEQHKASRRQVLKRIQEYVNELENLETGSCLDDAVEIRRAACDRLANAVDALLSRTTPTYETTNVPT
mgnify:CR=1 FL=1